MSCAHTTNGLAEPTIGRFPQRHDTVTAAVLGQLLEGRQMTSMAAVRGANTTRLAPIVHRLKKCGWQIEAPEIKVATSDGRVAIVSLYGIPEPVRTMAMMNGAQAFCDAVALAREQLRQASYKA